MNQAEVNRGRIFEIAKENYNTILSYLEVLEEEGYWENPGQILGIGIYDMFDKYLQSVLISMAVSGGEMNEYERYFIVALPIGKQFEFGEDSTIPDETIRSADLFLRTPPILLQLFGLRDYEKDSNLTGYYFNALINIMVAMSWMNEEREKYIIKYIKNFYHSVEVFLNKQSKEWGMNERFMFRKVTTDPELPPKAEIIIKTENEKVAKDDDARQQIELEAETLKTEEVPIKNHHEEERSKDRLEKLLSDLNGLVGLTEVKVEVNSLINLIKIRKIREEKGLPQMDMSYHMVFTGSPGTGKTTIARLVAEIYKELGILSKGTLVETDRAGLVAGYVGQTALKVKEVVDKAIGGVLFIDEAYALAAKDSNDFGREAIDTLVKLMEDHRDDLVVIVAGYTKEMKEFLDSNTGLVSRFNKFIEFKDYTAEELQNIMISMADKVMMKLTDDAKEELQKYLDSMTAKEAKVFGNARGIRNLFETAVVNQANRLVKIPDPDLEQLSVIEKEDLGI